MYVHVRTIHVCIPVYMYMRTYSCMCDCELLMKAVFKSTYFLLRLSSCFLLGCYVLLFICPFILFCQQDRPFTRKFALILVLVFLLLFLLLLLFFSSQQIFTYVHHTCAYLYTYIAV